MQHTCRLMHVFNEKTMRLLNRDELVVGLNVYPMGAKVDRVNTPTLMNLDEFLQLKDDVIDES